MSKLQPFETPTVGYADQPFVSSGMLRATGWEQGTTDNLAGAGSRLLETFSARYNGPKISPQEAQDRFGTDGLSFTEPITEAEAAIKQDRKKMERRRQFILAQGINSPAKWISNLAVSAVAGLSNPVDAISNFIPFVGSAAKAGQVAARGGGILSRAMARGVVTTEALQGLRYPGLSASVIEGLLGQASVEPFTAWANAQDQADYGVEQAAMNIVGSGVLAGVLRGAGDAFLGLSRHARAQILSKLAKDYEAGRPMDDTDIAMVSKIVDDRHGAGDQVLKVKELAKERMTTEEFQSAKREIERIRDERIKAGQAGDNLPEASTLDVLYEVEALAQRGNKIANRLVERFHQGERSPEVVHAMSALIDKRWNPAAETVQVGFKSERVFGPGEQVKQATRDSLKALRRELRDSELRDSELIVREVADRIKTETDPKVRGKLEQNQALLLTKIEKLRSQVVAAESMVESQLRTPLTPEETAAHQAYVESGKAQYAPMRDVEAEYKAAMAILEQKFKAENAVPPPLPVAEVPKGGIHADPVKLEAEKAFQSAPAKTVATPPSAAAAKPGTPAAAATKEPWQMTKAEVMARTKRQLASSGMVDINASYLAGENHREIVRDALREGKPVPPEVLAEYGLKPNAPAAAAKAETPVATGATGFKTSQGSEYAIDEKGNTTRLKKSVGKGQGELHEARPVVFLSPAGQEVIMDVGRAYSRIVLASRNPDGSFRQLRPATGEDIRAEPDLHVLAVDRQSGQITAAAKATTVPEIGKHPFEIAYKGDEKDTHMGNAITELKSPTPAATGAKAAESKPTSEAVRLLDEQSQQLEAEVEALRTMDPEEKASLKKLDEDAKQEQEANDVIAACVRSKT